MPTDLKDPEKSQEDIASAFNNIIDNSLSDLKGLGSNREGDDSSQSMSRRQRRKAARSEVKQNKKDNIGKKDQKAKGENDPLNQKHQTDKNIGHIPGLGKLTKAARQGKRGERMDAAKTMAKRYAMKKLRKAVVKKLKQKIAQAALSNPYVLGAIGIFLFIILIIIALGANDELYADPNDPNQIPLTLSKTGPTEAQAGDELTYQIVVGYAGQAQDITITDRIPEGTEFEPSTPPPARYDAATRTVTWSIKEVVPPSPAGLISNVNTTLSLTLKATRDNDFIVNQAEGFATGEVINNPEGGGGPDGPNFPPTQDNCGGKYSLKNPIGNFGDPQCDFEISKLGAELKRLDEPNAYKWDKIVECESSYIPNAYASHESIGTPDLAGAWGLFQMGRGKNGVYDHGDVNWPLQISNAINDNYKRVVPAGLPSFRYWQCAGELGYW